MKHCMLLFLIVLVVGVAQKNARAQATSFTYQGQLRLSGEPFTGMADLEFRLYDQLSAGTEIGSAQLRPDWPVEDGLFQVELDFGSNAFDGSERYLEVRVDGAPLIPRQKVTATPYALLASGLASGSVGGGEIDPTEVQLRVVGTCPAGEYVQEVNQDGSVVCGVDADAGGTVTQVDTGAGLTGGPIAESGTISVAAGGIGATEIDAAQVQQRVAGTCPAGQYVREVNQDGSVLCGVDALGNDWRLAGNAGTNPSTDFLGTTDATPLEIRTANARSLRIEPSAELFDGLPITANVIAGSRANEVAAGVRGAAIAGGGVPPGNVDPAFGSEDPNRIHDHYGAIGGGFANTVGDSTTDVAAEAFATIAGGFINEASGARSAIGGGQQNTASGFSSTVGGGFNNTASGIISTVGGGQQNTASSFFSTVAGGFDNTASKSDSTVGGGESNTANGSESTVGGGYSNTASGSQSTVGGGDNNTASGSQSTVGGGAGNTASAFGTSVGGGENNEASVDYATVAGGNGNTASGNAAMVPGGITNTAAGNYSLAAGRRAKANHAGAFVWADSADADFASSGADQFAVRAGGGVGFGEPPSDYFVINTPFGTQDTDYSFGTGALRVRINGATRFRVLGNGGVAVGNSYRTSGVPERGMRVAGLVELASLGSGGSTSLCLNGDGAISDCSSSARYKHDIVDLDTAGILIEQLRPVSYRWKDSGLEDLGLVAEEVAEIEPRLVTLNRDGEIEGVKYRQLAAVLVKAVQEQQDEISQMDRAMTELRQENARLNDRLARVENRQASGLASLREELAMLRETLTPSTRPRSVEMSSYLPDR